MNLRAELGRFDTSLPVARAVMPPSSWYVEPAMYALEMTRGWFAAHNVRVGQPVAGLPNAATR